MIVHKDKKILFLHGFYASGQCVPALALKDAFKGRADVLTPDLSIHPQASLNLIMEICDKEHPAVLVGNSCGSFYAQMVASVKDIPALLGNPYFKMTEFLKTRIGEHQFKSPRRDGNQKFIIDDTLIMRASSLMTVTIVTAKTMSGDCLVDRTRWHTLSRSFWNIIAIRSISLAAIPRRLKKFVLGMCRWLRNCSTIVTKMQITLLTTVRKHSLI